MSQDKPVIWFNDNDDRHRSNGPAVQCQNNISMWFLNDRPHRYYGEQDSKTNEWWIHGIFVKQ